MDSTKILENLINHYNERYEIHYNINEFGFDFDIVATFKNRSELTMMGFRIGKGLSPEATEKVFVTHVDSFDDAALDLSKQMIDKACQKYVSFSKDHGYTLLSLVVFANSISHDTIKQLKKYKYRIDEKSNGWAMSRVVVILSGTEMYQSHDGKDLMTVIKKANEA